MAPSANVVSTTTRVCKCCGASNPTDYDYCPNCGQSMSIERIQPKSFLIEVMSGLLRLNRGILYTCAHLLVHPWNVIRDYLKGRRVVYTPPVNLLVLLGFIIALISSWRALFTATVSEAPILTGTSVWYRIGVSLGEYFRGPSAISEMVIYIPSLLAVYLVYRKKGAKKYNWAEYFAAMIYIADASLIFDIVTYPLALTISAFAYSIIDLGYVMAICLTTLYKAFPMDSKKSRYRHFIYVICLALALYFIIAILPVIL
jgi:hypothetical protein